MPSDQNKLSFIDQIHNFVRTKTQDAYQNLAKGIPGHVSKILENDFLEFTIDATGPYTLPKIQIPQAFSKYHREPTQVGDKGVAVPTDYNIGGESGDDGSTANLYPRGNLTPLTFHPISNKNWPKRDPNQFLVTGGPSGHKVQSQDGTTSQIIDALNNILHTVTSGNILHTVIQGILSHVSPNIQHIASTALTIANTGGNPLNLVASHFIVGAAGSDYELASTSDPSTPPTPPQPTGQTIFKVIGTVAADIISASGMISAGGGMAGAGSAGGPPIASAPAGNVGEVISSVVIIPVTLTAGGSINIASITLTPGDWDVCANIWMDIGASGANNVAAGISNISSNLPALPDIGLARAQLMTTLIANGAWSVSLGPCRVLISTSATYYLIGYASNASTATGCIWARRLQ